MQDFSTVYKFNKKWRRGSTMGEKSDLSSKYSSNNSPKGFYKITCWIEKP